MTLNKNLNLKLKNLRKVPGVYFYYDSNDRIIYIGKASVLKHRVNSYFVGAHDTKTEQLISEIADVKWQETKSVIEALILESNLIKKHKPKYNIREKDDKSFVQIALTKEDFPRFLTIRPTEKDKLKVQIKKYFGPYTNGSAVKEILSIIRRVFTFRDCTTTKFNKYKKSGAPCLNYPINLCPAPCNDYISKNEYSQIVKQISDLLSGKTGNVIRSLKKQMKEFSEKNEYEKAAKIRDRIWAFKHINDVAAIKKERSLEQYENIPNRIEVYDISNMGEDHVVGSMVVFIGGEVSKKDYRLFKIKNQQLKINNKILENNDEDSSHLRSNNKGIIHNTEYKIQTPKGDPARMAQVIRRRFGNDWTKPDLIILDGGKGQLSAVLKELKIKKLKIPVIAVAKGPTRKGFQLFKNSLAKNIVLDRKFIEHMRDEAHRFAINYQRKLARKGLSE